MRWFKHMAASADDEKLSRLKDAFGLEGYGFWWSVVEIVAEKVGEDAETSAEFSPKKWGNLLGISPKKFRMLAEFCANLGLFSFVISENLIRIDMPNILKFRDEYTERQHKKSGQNRDKLPPLLTDTDTDKEEELNTPPHPPRGGECDGGDKALPPHGEKPKAKRPKTGGSAAEWSDALAGYTQNDELRQTLEDFRQMRERIRKPMTGQAQRLILRELDKLAGADDALKIAVVEQSIRNAWQDVYALKTSARASPAAGGPPARPVATTQAQKQQQENSDMAMWLLQRRHARQQEEHDDAQPGNHAGTFDAAYAALPASRAG